MRAMQMVAQECDRMTEEYRRLLALVARARAGEVDIRDVSVDLLGLSWQYVPGSAVQPDVIVDALRLPTPAPTVQEVALRLAEAEAEARRGA